jgi:hypothetical protein
MLKNTNLRKNAEIIIADLFKDYKLATNEDKDKFTKNIIFLCDLYDIHCPLI